MVQKIVQKWSKGLRVQSILYSMPFLCCVMLVSIESIPRPVLKASSFMWLWLALKSTQRKEDYNECHDMTELFINYLLNNLHNSTIMFNQVTSYIGSLGLVAIPFSNFYVYGQMNELPEIGSFLGSPRGKHCNSLERNVWRKVVWTFKKRFQREIMAFFAAVLSLMDKYDVDIREV